MRLVADQIRGAKVHKALDIVRFSKKEASTWIEKCLLSAIANWEYAAMEKYGNAAEADEFDLRIVEIRVDDGAFLKRISPAPHGRAHRVRKRTCHVHIVVDNFVYLPAEVSEKEVVEAETE